MCVYVCARVCVRACHVHVYMCLMLQATDVTSQLNYVLFYYSNNWVCVCMCIFHYYIHTKLLLTTTYLLRVATNRTDL